MAMRPVDFRKRIHVDGKRHIRYGEPICVSLPLADRIYHLYWLASSSESNTIAALFPMHPTAYSVSPAHLFEQAKRDFVAGDFENAVSRGREADRLLAERLKVTSYDPVDTPLYSIIVVTYRDTPDVREAFSHLAPYSSNPNFEIVIVNNGNPAAEELSSSCFPHYKIIDVGFNYGCSGARNIGARTARGDLIIFVDDDGFVDEGAIENLIDVIKEHNAVMVRGRVVPKSQTGVSAKHYDLGDAIISAAPTAECLLICRRDEYIKHGGFDILLAGHEGWALCSKMYRLHGPDAFLYAPQAIIRHDYADNAKHAVEKTTKFQANDIYLAQYYPLVISLRLSFKTPEVAGATRILELNAKAKDLQKAYDKSRQARQQSQQSYRELQQEHQGSQQAYQETKRAYDELQQAYQGSQQRYQETKRAYDELQQACQRARKREKRLERACRKWKHRHLGG